MDCNVNILLEKFPSLSQRGESSIYNISVDESQDLSDYVEAFNSEASVKYGLQGKALEMFNANTEGEFRTITGYLDTHYPIERANEIRRNVTTYNNRYGTNIQARLNLSENSSEMAYLDITHDNTISNVLNVDNNLMNELEARIIHYDNHMDLLTEIANESQEVDRNDLESYQEKGELGLTEPLFSPAMRNEEVPNERTILNDVSFKDWYDSRVNLRNSFNQNLKRFYNQKNYDKVRELNKVIQEIDNQIIKSNSDLNNPEVVYSSALGEIELIDSFLNEIINDPVGASNAIDVNMLDKRIGYLNLFFKGVDPITGEVNAYEETGTDVEAKSTFLFNFRENMDQEKFDNIVNKLNVVLDKLNNSKVKIIQGVLLNDALINNHLETTIIDKEGNEVPAMSQEVVDYMMKLLTDKNFEISELSKRFLGAYEGGGLMGQLLASLRDTNFAKETGSTQNQLFNMSESWKKIKDKIFNINGKNQSVADVLFEKNQFGDRTNKLKSRYSNAFYGKLRTISELKKEFFKSFNDVSYAHWMSEEKISTTKINPAMLSSVIEKYKDNQHIGEYLKDADLDKIKEYEDGLRKVLGDTMYEIETKKALEAIDNYVDSVKFKSLGLEQAYQKNPFLFIKNFESSNYAKRDSSSRLFLEPTFIRSIPNTSITDYYDSNFQIDNDSEVSDFYKSAFDLLVNYVNPTFKSENVKSINPLEVLQFEDILEKETMANLNLFGKVSKNMLNIWKSFTNLFYDPNINAQNRIKEKGDVKHKLQINHNSYGKKQHEEVRNLMVRNWSDEQVKNRAYEVFGKEQVDSIIEENKKANIKYILADGIARREINETVSSNLFESIKNSVLLANDIRVRRSVLATFEAMRDFINQSANDNDLVTRTKSNVNIAEFFDVWGLSNIYGYKHANDLLNPGGITRVTHKEIGLPKRYSEADKVLKKFLSDELKSNDVNKSTYNFTIEENGVITTYKGVNGKFSKTEVIDGNPNEVAITPMEISQKYENYLTQQLDKLGIAPTLGSIALGSMGLMIKKQLWLKPRAGIKNREQGRSQTLAVAASGRYGFDMDDYHRSRKILRGTNFRKYFFSDKFAKTPRGKLVETIKLFQSAMQLQQNRADELAIEGKYDGNSVESAFTKVGDFLMDFAINNPEWHNQTEIALSILQNTYVEDKNGVKHKFFNGNDAFIYLPGTMELKEEFNTEKNRALWVDFKEYVDKDGKRHTDSLYAITKIKVAIQQTQGNYNNKDIIHVQNSVSGKLLTMYQRYLYNNVSMQFGTKKVDITTGQMDIKGRKIALAEHIPTTLSFLLGVNGIAITSALISGSVLAAPLVLLTGLGSIGGIAFAIKQTKNDFNVKRKDALNEWKLAANFAMDYALRTIQTPVAVASYGKVDFSKTNLYNNLNNKYGSGQYEKRGLSKYDRQLITESAQDVATKFNTYIYYTVAILALQALYAMVVPGEDDDEIVEGLPYTIRELVEIEKVINAALNDRNQLEQEITKFSNPLDFTDEATSLTWFKTMQRSYDHILGENNLVDRYMEGRLDANEALYKASVALPIPLPNEAMKTLLSTESGMLKDPRVYDGTSELDKRMFYDPLKSTEKQEKRQVEIKRAKLKQEVTEVMRKKLVSEYREQGKEIKSDKFKEDLDKKISNFMKKTNKRKTMSYEKLNNSDVWDERREALKKL